MDQGLPVNFENTASTWQNMPGMAASFTGIQNQIAQDNIRALQQAFAKEQAYKEQTRPVELQNLVGAGALQQAQARNQDALTRYHGLQSDELSQLMPSKVDLANAISKYQIDSIPKKKLADQVQSYKDLSVFMENPNVPNWQKVKTALEVTGTKDPDGSIARQLLPRVKELPKVFQQMADHAFKNSSDARLEGMKEEGALKRAGVAAGATKYAADRSLEGTKYRADSAAEIAQQKKAGVDFETGLVGLKKASEIRARLISEAAKLEESNPALAASYRARADDERLVLAAQAEQPSGGAATVEQKPGQRPQLVPRGEAVKLVPGGDKPKANQDPLEGRTATNDKGEKIIRKNGKWVPYQ